MTYEDQYKAAKSAGQLVNLTPTYIEYKQKGDGIVGKYLGHNQVQSSVNQGHYNQYLFETDNGLVKFHLGSAADMEAGRLFRVDGVYSIVYEGKISLAGGKAVHKYQIDQIASGREEEIPL